MRADREDGGRHSHAAVCALALRSARCRRPACVEPSAPGQQRPGGSRVVSRLGRGGVGVVVSLLALLLLPQASAQQMCPPPSQLVCNRCPNQCRSCVAEDHNIKCPGASWGNINSTFMNISCGTPPELSPPEQFPLIPILAPAYRAPLDCAGTVQKGLWPFDADNMTFTVETMFRDPENPEQLVNAVHLHCVKFSFCRVFFWLST